MKIASSIIWLVFAVVLAGFASAQQSPSSFLYHLPELSLDAPLSGALDKNDGQNFKDGARLDQVKLYLQAGDVVELRLRSDSFDTFLSVYDPAGQLIALNDDAEDYSQSASIIEAEVSGRYMVVVSGYSDIDLGSYSLSATRLTLRDSGDIKVGQVVSGLLNAEDEQLNFRYLDSYTFTLKKPTTIDLVMHSTTVDSYLILLGAGGETVLNENDDDEAGYTYDAHLQADLPAGEYIVWATTNGDEAEGFYSLMMNELK